MKKKLTSPTWPYVLTFAKRMEAKLAKNRHKGDREGWLQLQIWELKELLKGELEELAFEIERNTGYEAEKVANECADIANFAMMLADVALADESSKKV